MIELIRAPNPGAFTLDGTNSWIIDGTVVIDPGPAIESHVDAILRAAPELKAILVTHRHADHAPAALPLKKRSGAAIVAPPGVLSDREVDRRISGGEMYATGLLDLEVIATPGHTGEHVCFLSSAGDLFTGDMVLGAGTTTIFPPDGNMGEYLRSLRALRQRQPRRIFPGHGPIREDADELLGEYIDHRIDRERQILEALQDGPLANADIRARVYPELDPALHGAAEAQIEAHLTHLAEQGLVQGDGGVFRIG